MPERSYCSEPVRAGSRSRLTINVVAHVRADLGERDVSRSTVEVEVVCDEGVPGRVHLAVLADPGRFVSWPLGVYDGVVDKLAARKLAIVRHRHDFDGCGDGCGDDSKEGEEAGYEHCDCEMR